MVKDANAQVNKGVKRNDSRGKKRSGNDLDAKIRKTIGWYNKQGNLQDEIKYDDVAPWLMQLGSVQAGIVLKKLEGKEAEIKNPTGWLVNAAKRAGADHGMAGAPVAGDGGYWVRAPVAPVAGDGGYWVQVPTGVPDKRIGKAIAEYNKNGSLQEEIRYDKVAPLLAQLDTKKAEQLLRSLEGKESEIKNPTAWLASAARKAGAQDGGGGVWGGGEVDKKIRTMIGWYNKQGNLQQEIKYDKVSPLLSQLEIGKALQIIKGLDGKEAEINDPTAWICHAARKAGSM